MSAPVARIIPNCDGIIHPTVVRVAFFGVDAPYLLPGLSSSTAVAPSVSMIVLHYYRLL